MNLPEGLRLRHSQQVLTLVGVTHDALSIDQAPERQPEDANLELQREANDDRLVLADTRRQHAPRAPASRWTPYRSLARALLLLLALAAFALVPPSLVYLRDELQPAVAMDKDFGQEYLLARAVADGVNPYLPIRDLAERYLSPTGLLDKTFPTPHPPTVGLLLMPLSSLEYTAAVQVWFGVQLVSLVLGVALLLRSLELPWRRLTPLVVVLMLGWGPAVEDLAMGQLTLPLLALLSGSLLAFRKGRPGWAGALLGVALLVKPIAWPWLLLLAWRRSWSSLISAACVGALGLGLVLLHTGTSVVIDYLTRVLPADSAQYAAETTNISLWTFGPRLFRGVDSGLLAGTPPVLVSADAARVVGLVVPLLVLAAAFAWLARTRRSLATGLGVLTAVAILVNPISWQYYLVLALIPAAQLLSSLRLRGYPRIPTVITLLIGLTAYLTIQTWYELQHSLSTTFASTSELVPSLAGLLVLGPSYAVAALAIVLAWISRPTAIDAD